MQLMIFFVNKPKTFLMYIFGFFLIVSILSLIYGFSKIATGSLFVYGFYDVAAASPFLFMIYTIMYGPYLFWKFFLRNEDVNLKIKNINIYCLSNSFKWFFGFNLLLFVLIVVSALIAHLILYRSLALFVFSFLAMILSSISYSIFQGIILTKLVSEGIKNNVGIKITSLSDIYAEAREILVKKLIN